MRRRSKVLYSDRSNASELTMALHSFTIAPRQKPMGIPRRPLPPCASGSNHLLVVKARFSESKASAWWVSVLRGGGCDRIERRACSPSPRKGPESQSWRKTNPNGGAIALGHPVGCSGAFIATKALYELKRINGRYALVTMCIGGGQGIACVFENL